MILVDIRRQVLQGSLPLKEEGKKLPKSDVRPWLCYRNTWWREAGKGRTVSEFRRQRLTLVTNSSQGSLVSFECVLNTEVFIFRVILSEVR